MDYKKLLIQQQTFNGTTYTNVGVTIDTQSQFGVVCQEFPFKYLPETKDLPKRDWYDEDGEDVYIPKDGLRFAAYDLEVKFLYTGTESKMTANIKDFIDFICGRINYVKNEEDKVVKVDVASSKKNVMLAMYDQYTKTGRRGVIVKEVSSELLVYDDRNGQYVTNSETGVGSVYVGDVVGLFKVKFRVTDPVFNQTLYA